MSKTLELYPSIDGYEIVGKIIVDIESIEAISIKPFSSTLIFYMKGETEILELYERMVDCERRYYSLKAIIDSQCNHK